MTWGIALLRFSFRHFSTTTKAFKICLTGAPGVGKGTFGGIIGPHYDIPIISSGDLIRKEIKSGSKLGKEIERINREGHLVSDEIVFAMVRKRLDAGDTNKGFLLDGYPRKVSQAELLEEVHQLDVVLNIALDEDVLTLKAVSRRVCSSCGANYNLAQINRGEIQMPPILPQVEGVCDKCGGTLIQREDDKEDIVRNRLRVYHKNTHPLIKYYSDKNILLNFQVRKGIADAPDLIKLLDAWRQKKQN